LASTISNAATRRPVNGWRQTLAATLALLIVALAGWEVLWRVYGVEPSIRDDANAWCIARGAVQPDGVVLVGTSRLASDVDPRRMAAALGRPVHQLALTGTSPIPVLEHLADTPEFAGTVVVDWAAHIVLDAKRRAERERRAHEYLGKWNTYRSSPGQWLEARIRRELQSRLASLNDAVGIRSLLRSVRTVSLPVLPFIHLDRDRFRRLDFSRTDIEERRAYLLQRAEGGAVGDEADVVATFARLEDAATAIRARGGEVVFVRLPVHGDLRASEQDRYPRVLYWDRFVAATAATTIHFSDHPDLAQHEPPDGSHLDLSQTAGFTTDLAALLQR